MSPTPLAIIDRLDHLLAAWRGIARAIDPDPVFSEHDRNNLYALCMVVIEQQEHCLQEFMHNHAAPRTSVPPAQDQEDDDHDD